MQHRIVSNIPGSIFFSVVQLFKHVWMESGWKTDSPKNLHDASCIVSPWKHVIIEEKIVKLKLNISVQYCLIFFILHMNEWMNKQAFA